MARRLMFEDLVQDVRIGLRGLLRAPLTPLTIVLTVGLGIGATTVIFAAIDAALLRSLPYADPARLVRIYTDAPPNRFPFSVADYLALASQQTRFEQVAGYAARPMAFTDGRVAERLKGKAVSWTYLSVLGVKPALGRDFTEADGRPGSPPAVIVSYGFWQRRLSGRADAIGQPIMLDGTNYTVAGVLPASVGPLEQDQEFFVAASWTTPPRKGPFFITALARLRRDADRSLAADELRAINRRLFPVWRASYQDDKATWSMMDLQAFVVGDVRTIAGLALVAVALVWLIACTNASNLLFARVTSRRRELAVRAALGASRGRVVRYLLAESGLLALGAAAIGIGLTWLAIRLLRDVGAAYFPRTAEIALDGPVVWFLAALTAGSTILFGLVPAIHGTGGAAVEESLRSGGRSSTGTRSVRRLRRVLVGSQFAIATPLLVIAGLLLVSLNELGRVNLGFNARNVVSGSLLLPVSQYPDARAGAFWDEIQRRAESIPGVSAVAFADGRPPNDVNNFNNFDLEDAPTPAGQSQPVVPWVSVSPEYFQLLGLNLLQGRLLDRRDALVPATAVQPIVVDRAWARRFFPNRDVIGKRLTQGGCTQCPWTVVVGVVNEVKYAGLDKPDEGTVYAPLDPQGRSRYLVLRTAADPASVLPALREGVRGLDAGLPLSNVATIDELVERSLARPRSLSMLVGVLASVALALSIVGIYGVMAYYVQQHRKDIGIRLALGGSRGDLFRLVVGQGMGVVTGGVAMGLAAALPLTRAMSSLLFGVGTADAATFAAVGGLLIAVAFCACALPARRAIGVQPAMVLRDE
ncbi:MAG TPA: ABC transporter permease [Vicinamibacterales bacterium]|jgi:predicted permease|nr:ABC transporter permease [Vicinamibacterales bacterium]